MKLNTRQLVLAALFAALMVVGAKISAYFGDAIPFSMQPLIAMMAGVLLGSKTALASQVVYIFMGLIGLPVFTRGGGLTYVLEPSFGYLLGFALGAYVIGLILENILDHKKDNSIVRIAKYTIASLVGLSMIYIMGVGYWYILWNVFIDRPIQFSNVVKLGVIKFLLKDVITCIVAALIGERIGGKVKLAVYR